MGTIRILVRSVMFVILTFTCTIVAATGSILGGGHRFALGTQQFWSKAMLWVFGIRTVAHGESPGTGLLMSNHQSYLDIWMIPKYTISVFVAKIEVKRMPLMGWGASSVNTVYVDRNNKDSRQNTKREIADRLANGRSVIVFPEGTTGSGQELLPFKLGMFYSAAEADIPIIPVAIFYEDAGLAWFGDDNMALHFFRNFSKGSHTAHIVFGKPIRNSDGDQLMEQVRNWQLQQIAELRKSTSAV